MVAAHFASAGGTEEFDRSIAKEFFKLVEGMQVPGPLRLQFRLIDDERTDLIEKRVAADGFVPLCQSHTGSPLSYVNSIISQDWA